MPTDLRFIDRDEFGDAITICSQKNDTLSPITLLSKYKQGPKVIKRRVLYPDLNKFRVPQKEKSRLLAGLVSTTFSPKMKC